MKLHLRLLDPPDLAPYAAVDLDDPTTFTGAGAAFPYEANDNRGTADYGLSLSPDGSGAAMDLEVTPPASKWATFYLKVPERYSGDNFQVEVTKCSAVTGQPLPQRVVSLSPVYTSWKRIFVERDRMFQRGGLLARDYDPAAPDVPNQVRAWNWTNVQVDDFVVLFQSDRTEDSPFAEYGRIAAITPSGDGTTVFLDLDLGLDPQGQPILLDQLYEASYDHGTLSMDFAHGRCAGFGVLSGCDPEGNMINPLVSCFDYPDLRKIEAVLRDGFVEVTAASSDAGALPYVAPLPQVFGGFELQPGSTCTQPSIQPVPGYDHAPKWKLTAQWFPSLAIANRHWVGGVSRAAQLDSCTVCSGAFNMPQYLGITAPAYRTSYVMPTSIVDYCQPSDRTARRIQNVTNHEAAHLFYVNPTLTLHHCDRCTWIAESDHACSVPGTSCAVPQDGCLMNPAGDGWSVVTRLDRFELVCGDYGCPTGQPGCCESCPTPGDGAIRNLLDPIVGGSP